VGKTTTTVNIAAALASFGAQVLVIDLDPQGNASTALGIDKHGDIDSIYDAVVRGTELGQAVQVSPESPNLFCVPATLDLAGAEIELVSMADREYLLDRALRQYLSTPKGSTLDYVFIDCPPSLGLLTINACVAAREVLIPIQCEYYALEGVSQLVGSIDMIRSHLNPSLLLSTILLTMFDSRTNLAHQVVDDVRQHFPTQTLNVIIPRSVRVSEAPSFGQTVIAYDASSPGSVSYQEAAIEIAQRGVAR
jgi:chromosome partitioning protein